MKNLKLKAFFTEKQVNEQLDFLATPDDVLAQKDTYYKTNDDSRLKIREQSSLRSKIENSYAIHYERSDIEGEKLSVYDFFQFNKKESKKRGSVIEFIKVFGCVLIREIVVEKTRSLFLYENARIHIDTVVGLGELFVKIKVVIETKEQEKNASELLNYIVNKLQIKECDRIDIGYRELLLRKK